MKKDNVEFREYKRPDNELSPEDIIDMTLEYDKVLGVYMLDIHFNNKTKVESNFCVSQYLDWLNLWEDGKVIGENLRRYVRFFIYNQFQKSKIEFVITNEILDKYLDKK